VNLDNRSGWIECQTMLAPFLGVCMPAFQLGVGAGDIKGDRKDVDEQPLG
jgi:hypothetical protein